VSHSVTVADLAFSRPGFALGPLSFAVPAGGRLAIVGPSGSGKTTLLRCIAGLERAAAGTIRIGDRTVADASTNVPPDRRGVGLVFQDGALWPHLTALQHLTFAAPGLARGEARTLLARAGLAAHAHKKPAALSGGEAQRLGLVRALAPAPGVLLLDEPLRSVDVHLRDALVLLVRQLADERALTTILVTHDRDEALALATDLVVMHDGQLVEQGPALTLLQQPQTAFTAAFLLGAACLPATANGSHVDTPFGALPRPAGGATGDVRLVVLPGEARAVAANGTAAGGPTAAVLATTPADGAFRVRVALGEQLVTATADAPLPVGSLARLSLTRPARLLPWQREPVPAPAPPRA
jgi:iron(III) transport system ATP-binding protein